MAKLWEKQQLVIFGLILLLIAIFGLLQYRPLANRIHAIKQTKSAKQSAITKAHAQIEQLPSLRKQLSCFKEKVGEFGTKIPKERQLGTFLQEIADLMNRYSLKKQLVQPENEVQISENLTCIPIRVQCSGSISELFAFLKSLQSFSRLMRIEEVKLANNQDLSGDLSLTAKANIYYGVNN